MPLFVIRSIASSRRAQSVFSNSKDDDLCPFYSFVNGKSGVLGLSADKFASEPMLVEGLLGKKVVKVSAGSKHVACLVEEE